MYYTVALFSAFVLGIILVFMESDFLETTNDFALGILFAPLGILGCYLLYMFLEKKWKKEKPETNKMIDEIGNKELR